MTKTVILAEKPSQAKAYAEAFEVAKREKTYIALQPCTIFPEGAMITWGIGHLVSLKMPNEYKEEWKKWDLNNLPIIPEPFEFKVSSDKKEQFNAVKKLFHAADVLINACDIDREGSNIFYSILQMTGVKDKPIKRLWINSLEVEEIRKGFQTLHSNEKDLLMYNEAKTRQMSDWLVGMNASQLYSLLLQQKGLQTTLSIGRCQSPLVCMIDVRQKEIAHFVSQPFFEVIAEFKSMEGVYRGKAKLKTTSLAELTTMLAVKGITLQQDIDGFIQEIDKKEKRTQSPKLHSLSTLQTVANKKWKYSPAKVLEIMQALYEKKIVTYPRTDTNFITENEFAYLSDHVEAYQALIHVDFEANKTPRKRYVDGSKVQEHYAIIPTKTIPSEGVLNSLSAEEKHIYDEVLRNTLAMFHKEYVYEETRIVTVVNDIEFETIGKVELEKGWKTLFAHQAMKEDENTKDQDDVLPSVSKGETVKSILQSKEGRTTPPKPYTEGDLIDLMKTAGKKVEDAADREILKQVEGIGTEATRAGIIEAIKKNGYIDVSKNIVSVTKKGEILCEAIAGTLLSSPAMTAKWEGYLRQIGEGKGSSEVFIANIVKFISELIQTAPRQISSTKMDSALEAQKASQSKGACPVCQIGQIVDRKTFLSCSEYQNGCKFSINKTILGKKLTEKHIQDLLNKGKTALIKGFTSKEGKSFDASLVVKDGKVTFAFADKKG